MNAEEELLGSTLSSADESSNDKADGCGSSQMTRAWYFKSFDAHVCNFIFKMMLVESGRLSHDPKMGTFKPHVVRLHPTAYCSCPATAMCYHIIALRLSIGMPVSSQSKKVNLTQLKRAKTIENLVERDQDQ